MKNPSRLLLFATLAVSSTGAAPAAVGTGPTDHLFFSEDVSGILYALDPATGASTIIGANGVTASTVGLAPRDADTMFGSTPSDIVITQADGSGTTLLGAQWAEGLAYDDKTDTLYGIIDNTFFTIDTTTGLGIKKLTPPGDDVEGIAFAHGGVFGVVGFGSKDSNLYFYDPGSNSWSIVGDTTIDWDLPGLAYDPGSDTLYAKGSQDQDLYRIDPNTGMTTVIGPTGLKAGGGLAWLETAGTGIGTNYCGPANLNSTGQSAEISAFGTTLASANFVTLTAAKLPQNVFGYFLNSDLQGFKPFPPGSSGNLCLAGGIGRHAKDVGNTGGAGELVLDLDLTALPRPNGTHSVVAGETWNFQCWFRDVNPNSTSNFTDGIELVFN